MRRYASFLPFLLLVAAVAWFGSRFEPGQWHAALTKPAWHPPNWLFGPVWTLLYLLIAVAGWRLWQARPRAHIGRWLWGVQLVLNALWSWLFFGLQRPLLGLLDIVLLNVAVAALIVHAWRQDRLTAALLLPYQAWILFAAALNAALWWMN